MGPFFGQIWLRSCCKVPTCSTALWGSGIRLDYIRDITGCLIWHCVVQDTLLAFGQLVVSEQENVRRVQLANEYLNSAVLAGADGSSMPPEITR